MSRKTAVAGAGPLSGPRVLAEFLGLQDSQLDALAAADVIAVDRQAK